MTTTQFAQSAGAARAPHRAALLASLITGMLLLVSCADDTASTGEPVSADELALDLELLAELEWPTSMAQQPGTERLYVTEQLGRVRVVDRTTGELTAEPLLDIEDEMQIPDPGGEAGLLGIAFHPEEPLLYLSFAKWLGENPQGEGLGFRRVIAEYAVEEDGTIDETARRDVLEFDKSHSNHNGGEITFGPDGHLYAGFGDGTPVGDNKEAGQDPHSLFGTLVRIDPAPDGDRPYTIPTDNPFADGIDGAPEVWAYGLRNPWRFSFDAETDDLWIPDVGEHVSEEINFLPADDGAGRGANLGWSLFEGDGPGRHGHDGPTPPTEPDDYVPPIHTYLIEESDGCAIIGGYVYRGESIPALQGAYVFSDYCSRSVAASWRDNGGLEVVEPVLEVHSNVLALGEDADQELYFLLGDGIYRLAEA